MSEMSLSDVVPGIGNGSNSRRAADRAKQKRRRRRRRRTALVLLVTLMIVGGGVAAAWSGLAPIVRSLTEPDDFEGTGTTPVQIEVVAGDTGRDIGRTLQGAGVVKTVNAFADAAAADTRSASIPPGIYTLRLTMSARSALDLMLAPGSRITLKVTVPEGRRVAQIVPQLAKALSLKEADLTAAIRDPDAIDLPAAANGQAEGYLFPATYEFRPDVTAVEVIRAMVARTVATLGSTGVPPERTREIIIKASIIQAEGRNPEDFGKIARVLDNRLALPMKLQLDSTVSYATKKFEVTTTEAERNLDSPYNTYRYPGLPKGPISNPGEAAIEAALDPTPGPWLYFVAVNPDTGETKFAVTGAEHQANVEEFRAWMRSN